MRVLLLLKQLVSVVVFLLATGSVWADEPELLLDFNPEPVVIEKDADGNALFRHLDAQWLNPTGAPRIPWQVVTMLLPPDVELDSVLAQLNNPEFETEPGQWSVSPTEPAMTWMDGAPVVIWPGDKRIVNGQDLDIYEEDSFYPASLAQLLNTGRMRKWRLVQVALPLVRYNPVTGTLRRLMYGEISLDFDRAMIPMTDSLDGSEMADRICEGAVRRLTANYAQVSDEYEMHTGEDPPAQGTYRIITTSAIQAASDQLALFVNHKTSQGFDVQVITETDFGGGTGDTAAENIRAWLKAHYVTDSIEYVLLIGNPDPDAGDVPMKLLYPRSKTPFYWTPSDYYYADLTGDWDLDGDDVYGEYDDDFGTGGVDRNWEVIVGRIPHYGTIGELDSILERIIDYQSQPDDQTQWRKDVLLPMADLGTTYLLSDRLGEDITDQILTASDWSYHRIYESNTLELDPPPGTMPCTMENTVDAWSTGTFGLVVWWSHGSATKAVDVIEISRVDELNDNYKAFTFHVSCNTAWPEKTNNLAYKLLQHGAVCTVGSTRPSWSLSGHNVEGQATIEGMAYEYTSRVGPMGMPAGRALNELRQMIAPTYYSGALWMNYLDCNIYGDPSAVIHVPESRVHNLTRGLSYPVIEWAIGEAEDGDEIVLDPGTYAGIGNRDLGFCGKSITIRSTDPNDPGVVASTVIDCGKTSRAFTIRNSENVSITGLTISNGTTAIYCSHSSPTITNCTFSANTEALKLYYSNARIIGCTFAGNSGYQGGAIRIYYGDPEVADCTFTDNKADQGGAIYCNGSGEPVVVNSVMTGNSAFDGGAFYAISYDSFTIRDCTISGNAAADYGGGMYFRNGGRSVVNCTITGNMAGISGGALYCTPSAESQTITNCTISKNRAVGYGGGVFSIGSNTEIINSVLWGNTAGSGPEIALFSHYWFDPVVTVSCSDVEGGESEVYVENEDCEFVWLSSIDTDPIFVATGFWDDNGTPGDLADDIWNQGDYHLTADSPCIDHACNDAPEIPNTDFEGDLRIIDGDADGTARADMGADEFMQAGEVCEGDLDEDRDVDGSDLARLAASPIPVDLSIFAANFGRTDCFQ